MQCSVLAMTQPRSKNQRPRQSDVHAGCVGLASSTIKCALRRRSRRSRAADSTEPAQRRPCVVVRAAPSISSWRSVAASARRLGRRAAAHCAGSRAPCTAPQSASTRTGPPSTRTCATTRRWVRLRPRRGLSRNPRSLPAVVRGGARRLETTLACTTRPFDRRPKRAARAARHAGCAPALHWCDCVCPEI